MSKLMTVLGIILLAIGVALGIKGYVNPAQTQILGVSMDTAAILITGGILAMGLGGVIAALDRGGRVAAAEVAAPLVVAAPTPLPQVVAIAPEAVSVVVVEPDVAVDAPPMRIRFPGFGRKLAAASETAAVTGAIAAGVNEMTSVVPPSNSVQDTIAALDKAKADLNNAMGGVASAVVPPGLPPAIVAEPDVDEDVAGAENVETADVELYVIEERMIRGRPARVLSDNTVEAETDEGWMRFENLEHLNEYLDAEGDEA